MKNEILDKIKTYAINELKGAYGYCGSAEGEDMAMLNSDDGQGNDIQINIKVKPE